MQRTAGATFLESARALFPSKTVLLLLKGGVSLGLLVYLFQSVDLNSFLKTLSGASPDLLLVGALTYIAAQYLSAYRWQVLLKPHEIKVSVHRLFSFYLVGMFFNNFLPTSVGGDVVKGVDLYRHSGKGNAAVATVFLERYTGLIALLAIGLAAMVLGHLYFPDPVVALLLVGMAAAFIAGTFAVANRYVQMIFLKMARKRGFAKAGRSLSKLYETFAGYREHKNIFLQAVWISFGIQFLNILVYILLAEGLGISASWGYFFLFFPIVTVIAMLPLSFNGLGMREGMMVYLFAKVGVPSAQALALSLTWFFIITGISLLGGVIFALRRNV